MDPKIQGEIAAAEVAAMGEVAAALAKLGDKKESVERVIRWAAETYGLGVGSARLANGRSGVTGATKPTADFSDLPELYAAADPATDYDRALVVAHWLQVTGGAEDLQANAINSELKNLGHGVSNITDALDALIRRKPQYVIQTRKSGTSRQARKKYKVTKAGIDAVMTMVQKGQQLSASDEERKAER